MATKKKPASKQQQTKTAYVLALPGTMTAKEVVAKAAAEGVKLSESHVYNIRATGKKQGKAKPKVAKKGAKKSAAAKTQATHAASTASSAMSKADFVRSQAPTMKAAEVVKLAKKSGLKMSTGYVYEVRSSDKRAAAKKSGKAPKKTATAAPVSVRTAQVPAKASVKAVVETASGSEVAFRRMVVALGIERATAILSDVKRKLEQVIAGA